MNGKDEAPMKKIEANMAGTVLQVLVQPGDRVEAGQDVACWSR